MYIDRCSQRQQLTPHLPTLAPSAGNVRRVIPVEAVVPCYATCAYIIAVYTVIDYISMDIYNTNCLVRFVTLESDDVDVSPLLSDQVIVQCFAPRNANISNVNFRLGRM